MNSPKPDNQDEMATISIQNTDQMWDLLSGKLEEFYQAWESKSPPDLEKFLPESPQALRRFALIEMVKVDIEHRLQEGQTDKKTFEYAQQFPELLKSGKVEADLLFEELELRKRFGRDINREEYEQHFPHQVETILRFLGSEGEESRTRIYNKRSLATIQAGTQIDDFELVMQLGKGAFATVFLARQISMQRLVALKVSNDKGDEPKTLAQLDCKNIVRVYDVRDIQDPPCRLLYMKFVAGGSIHDIVGAIKSLEPEDRNGAVVLSIIDDKAEKTGQDIPLDSRTRQRLLQMEWFEIVFWLGAEIADGLAYAHDQGVLHRDLKPANILLTIEGVPQIVDFNVSFCSNVEGASAESFFGGSLAYMSPEQLEAFDPAHSREPDELKASSDIYSLGIILWELLFGQRPFPDQVNDGDYSELLTQLIEQRNNLFEQDPWPAQTDRFDVELRPVFGNMLEKDPGKRIQDAQVLAGELSLLSDRQSRELLRPKKNFWNRNLLHYLVLFFVLSVTIPSFFAAAFNLAYNSHAIIEPMSEEAKATFGKVEYVINRIAFPVGIGILVFASFRLWKNLTRSDQEKAQSSLMTRKQILRMPLLAVIIPLSIWAVCGLAYPIAMNMAHAEVTAADYLHFLTSLILCGMIASVYPFFLVAYVAIRYWYPIAFQSSEIHPEDLLRIERLTSRVWFFMALAVMLPTFSILLMVATQRSDDRILLAVLAGASFVGLGIVFLVFQKLQKHLETVRIVIGNLLDKRSL